MGRPRDAVVPHASFRAVDKTSQIVIPRPAAWFADGSVVATGVPLDASTRASP